MIHRGLFRGLLAAIGLVAMVAVPAATMAEIRVLSAGVVEVGLRSVVATFQQDTGNVVHVDYAAAPAIAAKFAADPGYDIVIAPPEVLDAIAQAGKLGADRVTLGKVGIGIAVRATSWKPKIAPPETLRRELLTADAVVFNRASTGLYIEKMLATLGIANGVNARSVRPDDSAGVLNRLLTGTAAHEIGFAALTEIRLFEEQGIKLIGPLPAGLQNTTTYVAAAVQRPAPNDSPAQTTAAALMKRLQETPSRTAFAVVGIEQAP